MPTAMDGPVKTAVPATAQPKTPFKRILSLSASTGDMASTVSHFRFRWLPPAVYPLSLADTPHHLLQLVWQQRRLRQQTMQAR